MSNSHYVWQSSGKQVHLQRMAEYQWGKFRITQMER